MFKKISAINANCADPDQMPYSAVSDLSLHWLPITLLEVSRLKWINYPVYTAEPLFFVSCIFLKIAVHLFITYRRRERHVLTVF